MIDKNLNGTYADTDQKRINSEEIWCLCEVGRDYSKQTQDTKQMLIGQYESINCVKSNLILESLFLYSPPVKYNARSTIATLGPAETWSVSYRKGDSDDVVV